MPADPKCKELRKKLIPPHIYEIAEKSA